MRKILMVVAALGVLGGGGAGAYFMLLKKPAEAALPNQEKVDEHAKAEEKKHGEEAPAPKFVKLDPLVVPVMDDEGVSQTISMLITFEVVDEEGMKKVEDQKPRIKDAMITNLYGLMNHPAVMDKGVLKVGYVKKRLNDISQKVMGEGVIKDVLLQMVQQNPT